MFQYLENLRKKPESHRRKTVFLLSLYITIFIAIIWAIVTSVRVARMDFSFDPSSALKKVPSLSDTFSNAINIMSGVMSRDVIPTNIEVSTTTDISPEIGSSTEAL